MNVSKGKKKKLKRLKVCTFNARSISSQERLTALEQEADRIRFDVIGLCETKRPGRSHIIMNDSGRHLYNSGNDDNSRTYTGVGFLISPEAHDKVASVHYVSDRIIQVILDLPHKKKLRITQVYAPTSNSTDEEYIEFLEAISSAISSAVSYDLIIGDFNACIGPRETGEVSTGKFHFGERNHRGQMLVDFCEAGRFLIMNSRYKKHANRKWTWQHPNGTSRNEIDFVICRAKCFLTDVSVIPSFAGSDHRLVRATLDIKTKKRSKPKKQKARITYKTPELLAAIEAELSRTPTFSDPHAEFDNIRSLLLRITKGCAHYEDRPDRISQETKDILEKRRRLKHGNANTPFARIEYAETCKLARKLLKRDIAAHYERVMVEAIKQNQIRRGKKDLCTSFPQLARLKRADGTGVSTSLEVAEIITEFYDELGSDPEAEPHAATEIHNFAPLTAEEFIDAAKKMKANAAPGLDGIPSKVMKVTMKALAPRLAVTMQGFINAGNFPEDLLAANMILLPKKSNASEIGNYRPISLLPVPYKTLTRIVTARIEANVRHNIPKEQAGFRRGFSTIDHIHAICQLLEKCREWLIPCYMVFIDKEKAFDKLKRKQIYEALEENGIDEATTELVRNLYANGTASISIGPTRVNIKSERGVRQGDSLSPLLFILTLQRALNQVDWDQGGIQIDDAKLSWLGYADDIVLFASCEADLQKLLDDVADKCASVGLKINSKKSKWISTSPTPAPLMHNGQEIELVNDFIYLGRSIAYRRPYSAATTMNKEISRRIAAGWACFNKVKSLLISRTVPIPVKRRFFDQCILPAFLYAAETWSLTKTDQNRLEVAQRRMERSMLGVTLLDKKSNEWIRQKTGLKDVLITAQERKRKFADKLKCHSGDRWTTRLTNWTPKQKRPVGRPPKRWKDDLPR